MKRLLMISALMVAVTTMMVPGAAQANLVTNPGFEGAFTGWSPSHIYISNWAEVVHSGNNGAMFDGGSTSPGTDANLTQNISLSGPGQYEFGGYLRFFTLDPVSNWDQGQISIGFGTSYAVVGSDPGNSGPFVDAPAPFREGIYMSNWIFFSGIYNYAGSGGDVLLNISLQNGNSAAITYLAADDIFVNQVPEPSTMLLLGSGLVGLVGYGRRRFKK